MCILIFAKFGKLTYDISIIKNICVYQQEKVENI